MPISAWRTMLNRFMLILSINWFYETFSLKTLHRSFKKAVWIFNIQVVNVSQHGQSFSFKSCRLLCSFLLWAHAISSLVQPFFERKTRNGTMVFPLIFKNFSICWISVFFKRNLLSAFGYDSFFVTITKMNALLLKNITGILY